MGWKVYDADTGELLDQFEAPETALPKPGERWSLGDRVAAIIDAVYVLDPATGETFIAVKVE